MSSTSRFLLAMSLALLVLPGAGVLSSASGAQNVPQAERLVNRWRGIVFEQLEASKAVTSDDIDKLFDEFVSTGAVRAVRDRAAEPALAKADAEVARLARLTARYGDRQPDGSVALTVTGFDRAQDEVCPAYPFCP